MNAHLPVDELLCALDAMSIAACLYAPETGFSQPNASCIMMSHEEDRSVVRGSAWNQILSEKDRRRIVRSFDAHREACSTQPLELSVSLKSQAREITMVATQVVSQGQSPTPQYLCVLRESHAHEWRRAAEQDTTNRELEQLIIDVSCRAIRAPLEKTDTIINMALADIGAFIGSDRAYRFSYDWETGLVHNTHEWCAPGITPEITELQNVPTKELVLWTTMHRRGLPFVRTDVMSLPDDDPLRQILEPQGIRSLITLPIMADGDCIGFIGFDSVAKQRSYTDLEISLLELLAELFANTELKRSRELRIVNALQNAEAAEAEARSQAAIAAEANTAKSDFLATMSHEIRTPLHVILGSIAEIEKTPVDSVLSRNVSILQEASQNLTQIIGDIMDFSKIEKNLVPVMKVHTSPGRIAERIDLLMRHAAESKGLALTIDTKTPSRNLVVDERKLIQIASNLCGNAIKFTPSGRVEVQLQLAERVENPSAGQLTLRVSDDGIGINTADLAKIEAPFYQGAPTPRSTTEGIGLGLSIVRGLVKVMGGTMEVTSEQGQGSIFSVRIPVSLNHLHRETTHSQQTFDVTALTNNPKKLPILMAEDNQMNRMLMSMFTEGLNCELDEAFNGREAVEKVEDCDYSVILMDLRMPELDGLEATRSIRAMLEKQQRPQPIIIAITASSITGDRDRCMEAGMNDLLAKPFSKDELVNVITKHVA